MSGDDSGEDDNGDKASFSALHLAIENSNDDDELDLPRSARDEESG